MKNKDAVISMIMKIKVGQLRSLIREMALRGTSRMISGEDEDEDEDDYDKRQVSRFFSTPKWKKDAERLFKRWSTPVYVIPVHVPSQEGGGTRAFFLTWQQALPLLERTDFDLEDLKSDLDSGAIIFLSEASRLESNFLPSVWNMIHGIFDENSTKDMAKVREQTYKVVDRFISEKINQRVNKNKKFYTIFSKALMVSITSKSGREGLFSSSDEVGDMISEMLTQAALTTNGCVLKVYENDKLPQEQVDDVNEILRELEDLINGINVRGILEDEFRGKIVSVQTFTQ